MKKLASLTLLVLFSFLGCSPAPRPLDHHFSTQTKLQAAHHWEIMAKDFARQFVSRISSAHTIRSAGYAMENEGQSGSTSLTLNSPYIYIQTNDISPFGKSLRGYLITKLTNLGYNISYSSKDATTIRWSVEKIRHNTERIASSFPLSKTFMAAFGYGLYKLYDNSDDFAAAIFAGGAVDAAEYAHFAAPKKVPNVEIILNLSVSRNGYLLARQSDTYYINEADACQYSNIPDFEGQIEAHLPAKHYQVVND